MSLPALASLTDFAAWEAEEVGNEPRALAVLAAASTLIRAHTGRVWVGAAGPEEDATEVQLATVRNITISVASRVYNNPLGLTQEATGPFSRAVAEWAALGLALTDDEKAQLATTPAGGGIPGLWSLRVLAPAEARATAFTTEFWEDDWEGDE